MKMLPAPAIWFPAIRTGTGTDVFTERLAAGLRRRGIRAEVTWLPHRAEYAPWTVPVPHAPDWATIAHVNTWLPRRFLPATLPIVTTAHLCVHDPALTPYKSWPRALYHRLWVKQMEQRVLANALTVVAVSAYTAELTRSIFAVQNITVIRNGIDVDGEFQPPFNRKPHNPFRLLYVGNWSARKGTDLLIPIMKQLGSGYELFYTCDRTDKNLPMEVDKSFHALGRLSSEKQIATTYREADALLLPTRLEGLPLVALEAQACGLPVIATRGSSLPEVIVDGLNGLLCPQDDHIAFAAAARTLAAKHDVWNRMCIAARSRAETEFSLDPMIDKYLDIYNKLPAPTPNSQGCIPAS